jgi:small subunit ribosomal protein S9
MARYYATGKRKSAKAKVWLSRGSGKIIVNGVSLDEWLGGLESLKLKVRLPLFITKMGDSVDIVAVTLGGGISAQADALKHGISKALCEMDSDLRSVLKPQGLLTRDARVVERKKYGKRKARRSPQFSKR